MALRKDVNPSETAAGNEIALREGLIPVSMEKSRVITAIFQHFESNAHIIGFGIHEDEESGLTFVEVNSTFENETFDRYLNESSDWWNSQPDAWRDLVHLALW